ncbi:MAG TPA: S8 family serine peptidase [Actinomycetota bacterium]|nr:S8 family serine peptidase [Actinomycetota bacterium]
MKRVLVAIALALALGVTPAAADDPAAAPSPLGPADAPVAGTAPVPAVPTSAEDWTQPAPTVTADPQAVVEKSGDSGSMTVVYAVQDGDSLRIETQEAGTRSEAADTIADIQAAPDVVAVEVDTTRHLTALPSATLASDPGRREQWALDQLQAESAWTESTGSGVTVAVIDSGVARHPDLAGAFVRGVNLVDGGDGRADLNGHGTHVAGIIAMTADNGIGGAGLAPNVTIMPIVVADAGGSVRAADSAKGIVWAVDHGADVLNLSYAGSASSVEQKAIQYAQSKGVVAVAAVGNAYLDSAGSRYNPVQYPAAFPGVLGVGSTTKGLRRSPFSEVGKQVDLVAPGGTGAFDSPKGIYSTYGGGGYVRMPGTSMATPYVSATVALILARGQTLGLTADPKDVILGTARDLGAVGRDDEFGFGLVSPLAAITKLDELSLSGATMPVIQTPEVSDRAVHRVRVRVNDGYLRYRIPARGRFVVAWQQLKGDKWTDPIKFQGRRAGRTWYTVRTAGGLRARILAFRNGAGKTDPIWVSPTFQTRTENLTRGRG